MFAFLRSRRADPPSVIDEPLLDMLAAAQHVATVDADAAFTAERAAAQKAAVLARLAATDDPRVLSFPPRDESAARSRRGHARPALGWTLAAAAAGLVIGVGTGHGLYPGAAPVSQLGPVSHIGPVSHVGPAGAPPAAVATHAPRPIAAIAVEADDEILGEVETALAGRAVDALEPLDRLTPTVVSLMATR
jgi:hypothetical protein